MANILIADDSAFLRRILCASLRDMGHTVVEAADGQEALKMALDQSFDMLISDINMPILDGLDLVEKLRALPDYKNIPILILSGESSRDIKQRGKDLGITGWMVKPFNPERLMAVINKTVGLQATK
ncbi:MAG TPA: response regulator [Gammaproteobacteria bacterium]|nr:response regulator [Gammaproteobacteria bacterium]